MHFGRNGDHQKKEGRSHCHTKADRQADRQIQALGEKPYRRNAEERPDLLRERQAQREVGSQ